MTYYYTENLAEFGIREIKILKDLLTAWIEQGLPEGFYNAGIKPAVNWQSGYMFLTNEDFQVAMLDSDGKLDLWHSFPYSGDEGFLADLIAENNPDDLHSEDVEYLLNTAEMISFNLPPVWAELRN